MQAKDISDRDVLLWLAKNQGHWSSHFAGWPGGSVAEAMPPDTPEKVVLAKMRALHRRGFVGGCPCGCRGDWEITDAGLAFVGETRTKPYTGY